jgi:hypothetical protein
MEHDKLKFDNAFGQLKVIGIVCVLLRHAHWYFTIPENGMIATLIPAVGEIGDNISA